MKVTEFLSQCRECLPSLPGDDLLSEIRCQMDRRQSEPDDPNAISRYLVLIELNRTLTDRDRPLIHYLLEQEILYHRALPGGVYESIKLCAYLLFRLGHVEDSIKIWRAKATNFDTHCGVDVQLLVAAGVEATLTWLKQQDSEDAQHASSWIAGCAETGDFRNLEGYREFASRYFGDYL